MNIPIFIVVSKILDEHVLIETHMDSSDAQACFNKEVNAVTAADLSSSITRGRAGDMEQSLFTDAGSFVKLVRR